MFQFHRFFHQKDNISPLRTFSRFRQYGWWWNWLGCWLLRGLNWQQQIYPGFPLLCRCYCNRLCYFSFLVIYPSLFYCFILLVFWISFLIYLTSSTTSPKLSSNSSLKRTPIYSSIFVLIYDLPAPSSTSASLTSLIHSTTAPSFYYDKY